MMSYALFFRDKSSDLLICQRLKLNLRVTAVFGGLRRNFLPGIVSDSRDDLYLSIFGLFVKKLKNVVKITGETISIID
jgi:hypothetical protein